MVGHHDKPVGKVASKTPITHLIQLALHTLVSSNSDSGRRPPLSHGRSKDSKRFFSPCHVSIIELRVNELQWSTNELRSAYTESQYANQIRCLENMFTLYLRQYS
jgi:hypothetical protein